MTVGRWGHADKAREWQDGYAAGAREAFAWCLDNARAMWMDQPSKGLEQLGKDIAREYERRYPAT